MRSVLFGRDCEVHAANVVREVTDKRQKWAE